MYAANDAQPIFGVPAKPAALRGKEEQGSGRMAYFEAAGIKISRSKADFAIQQKNQTGAQRQRVRFGKEEQRRERALTFEKSRSKRYKACSDVAPQVGLEPTTLRLTAACSTN